jgi:hypothetical protein
MEWIVLLLGLIAIGAGVGCFIAVSALLDGDDEATTPGCMAGIILLLAIGVIILLYHVFPAISWWPLVVLGLLAAGALTFVSSEF